MDAAKDDDAAQARPTPLCFIVDHESSIRHFLSLICQAAGVDTIEFEDGVQLRAAIASSSPDLIFCDIPLDSSDVIATLEALAERSFAGAIQLMSARGGAVLEHIRDIGERHRLRMLPALKKPIDAATVQKILADRDLTLPAPQAARISLDEALDNRWIEFWFQPRIDLRKKTLAGLEAFARVRHPSFGILQPETFMPGARESAQQRLAELSISSALKAMKDFAAIGIAVPISINTSANILHALPLADIMRAHSFDADGLGLIVDLPEEQVVADLALAEQLAAKVAPFNMRLALDEFGRGLSTLARASSVPFVELKIDRSFAVDRTTNKLNAAVCKSAVDLARRFGCTAAALGLTKASDVIALLSVGCDIGQGFLTGRPMPMERITSLLRLRKKSSSSPNVAVSG